MYVIWPAVREIRALLTLQSQRKGNIGIWGWRLIPALFIWNFPMCVLKYGMNHADNLKSHIVCFSTLSGTYINIQRYFPLVSL